MKECYRARISHREYGPDDYRNFCYGLYDPMYDDYWKECQECGAFCLNAKPIDMGEREDGR